MPKIRLLTSVVAVGLLACGGSEPGKPPKPPEFTEAFSNLPLPPDAELLTLPGVGHTLPPAAWETVVPAILRHTAG